MNTLRIDVLNPKAVKLLKSLADLNLIAIQPFKKEKNTTQKKELSISDFSFSKSQKNLKTYKGSLSDAVIEERRTEL
ncbi:hypothetical protein [Pedobacter paludis]|uniref:Uncharacterized protein n=1 Tax=Pedobacter paludis TaxID=2203212 RepID=A0A317EU84_9SPHI|nr:hypothetical protein [Pedobacter paludis]PWS30015.1 hypothetical protein DF947_20740 [Pedobacter paludis]